MEKVIETIKHSSDFISIDKYGKYIEDSEETIKVEYEIEYEDNLPPKMQDFIKLLKEDGVLAIWVAYYEGGFNNGIVERVWNFEYIDKITFKSYYLEINGRKIFYDAIFDFYKAKRW